MKKRQRIAAAFLCIALMVTSWIAAGCSGEQAQQQEELPAAETTQLGEGEMQFFFLVQDAEGEEMAFEIHTEQTTVGAALQELELISGEEGPYGLYVDTVNGTTVDYDADGAYWAFYVDGVYSSTGVDTTEIQEGATYSFRIEAA